MKTGLKRRKSALSQTAEHRGGEEAVAVFPRDELGRAPENGGPFLPGRRRPIAAGGHGRLDGQRRLGAAAEMAQTEDVAVIVGASHLEGLARPDLAAPDDRADLDPQREGLVEGFRESRAPGRARRVGGYRLVLSRRHPTRGIVHGHSFADRPATMFFVAMPAALMAGRPLSRAAYRPLVHGKGFAIRGVLERDSGLLKNEPSL
jgi:hypothetical protein